MFLKTFATFQLYLSAGRSMMKPCANLVTMSVVQRMVTRLAWADTLNPRDLATKDISDICNMKTVINTALAVRMNKT